MNEGTSHLPPLLIRSILGWTCLSVCCAAAAQTPPPTRGRISFSTSGERLPLTATRDLNLTAEQQEILQQLPEIDRLYAVQNHEATGTLGWRLIKLGANPSDEVRLKIANSLAWTGRLNEAYSQYELLLGTRFDTDARLALANAERWRDRADKAMPMFSQVLALDPSNTGARDGLEYGSRDLRPSTTVSGGRLADSGGMERQYMTVSHRWRDESNTKIYEVESRVMQDRLTPPGLRVNEADVTLRFQPLDVAMQPRVYVNFQGLPKTGAFGGVRLKLGDGPTHFYADRLAWGPLAVSARATEAGMTAYHLGVESTQSTFLGSFYGRLSGYRVSDSNTVLTSAFRFTPAWRPLGPGIKAYVSTDTRDVKFNTLNYWSPASGTGTVSVGLSGEWSDKDWVLYGSGQMGRPMYGESGNSWSASAGGKRWLGKDYALGVNMWGMSSWRDGANYRARSMTVNLEKLW